jgi:putative membrane protein
VGQPSAFFADDARKRASDAVKAVEAQTSAEIVVAVRRVSGHYRAADYHAGFVTLLLVVGYMLVAPQVFSVGMIALNGVAAFAVGTLLSANVAPLRRLLLSNKRLDAEVEEAARAAFYALGISRTSGRNGILVFLSTFERRTAVVPDIGIDVDALGDDYQQAVAAIGEAARALDSDAFFVAIETLGPPLASAMPRADDDVNELSDDIQ